MKALRPTNIPFPSTGSFTRASTATYIENGILKTAAINEPRWQDGQLLVEGEATNYCTSNNVTSPTKYTGGGGDGTIELLSDPFWPVVLRITKTVGGPGARIGIRWPVAAISDDEYTVGIWVRRPASVFYGYAVYCDMTKVAGGVVTAIKGLPLVPTGSWVRVAATAAESGASFVGGYMYSWVDGAVGDYIDVALPCAWAGASDSSAVVTEAIPVTRAADIITGTGLIYTSATDARPLWSNATTYSIGQVVRYNNVVYESLQNTNLNKQPDTNPTWWLNLGADNISAAFDGKVGTKTTATDKLRMIIKPGTNIDSVGYIEATASTISTSAVDEDYNTVYSYKSGLDSSVIEDWYDYFFIDPLGDPLTQVVHQGINSLDPNLAIGVEMIRSGTVELGVFVTGQTTTIGKTQYGLRAGIVDYSKKEADEFGNVTIVERTYSKRLEGDVYVYNYDLNKVQRFLYNVRATPVLWIASDDTELAEVSNVYGFYKDFSTTIAYPDVSMCSLQIEGLT